MKNPHVILAQQAIKHYLKTKKVMVAPSDLPKKMLFKKTGTFVSIHKKDGSLRGCVGTFLPTKKNIAEEIIANAIAAAQDPRFPPLNKEELPNLVYSVDILSKPRSAQRKEIDPQKYGLLVMASDGRKGLLLPNLPNVKTAEEQILFCQKKGGIAPEEKVKFFIFTVKRYKEKEI